MKTMTRLLFLAALLTLGGLAARAQTGPFSPEDWPTTRDSTKKVHFVVTDEGLAPPSDNWTPDLTILSGGDQLTQDFTIGGHAAKKVTGNYLNVADTAFTEWADNEFIDILVQVYGDAALFNAQGQPRNFNFLTGVLPELAFPNGGQVAVEARNQKWNWILFRIPNGVRPSDGTRFVGSIPANAQGATAAGGVNGGTIRFEGVPNFTVRVVAFGEEGAFGEPEAINLFFPADVCDPEPNTNLAGIDFHTNTANHAQIINNGDQQVTFEEQVGPAGDRRNAVRPTGQFLNFGITENYLGKPCNDPRTVKVCVDFYDDPNFQDLGVTFGPEAFATDALTGVGMVTADKRHALTGSGQWVRRSWTVPAVNLRGVNAAPLTAGPRFISENGAVAVSRFEITVFRVGDHPLAGQDPLAACFEDPNICTDAYGSFAELDLKNGVKNGLDLGSSGGDQNMIVAEAGPENDKRMAVRAAFDDGAPGFTHQYLNFAIINQALGPTSQPNARLAICATYFDDPELAGRSFRPEVYRSDRNGTTTFAFTPGNIAVVLEGSGQWRETYWELPDVKFEGVNQGPQAAARFTSSGKIFVSRLRYAVIRPCGPNAGKNALEDCKPVISPPLTVSRTPDGKIRLSWPANAAGFALDGTGDVVTPNWQPVNATPVTEGDTTSVTLDVGVTTYYRLMKP